VAARARLCNALLSYLLAPGWQLTMGETAVIPVLEAKPLSAMEGSAWDKLDPGQKTLQGKLLLPSHVLWLYYSFGHGQGQFHFGLCHLEQTPSSGLSALCLCIVSHLTRQLLSFKAKLKYTPTLLRETTAVKLHHEKFVTCATLM